MGFYRFSTSWCYLCTIELRDCLFRIQEKSPTHCLEAFTSAICPFHIELRAHESIDEHCHAQILMTEAKASVRKLETEVSRSGKTIPTVFQMMGAVTRLDLKKSKAQMRGKCDLLTF